MDRAPAMTQDQEGAIDASVEVLMSAQEWDDTKALSRSTKEMIDTIKAGHLARLVLSLHHPEFLNYVPFPANGEGATLEAFQGQGPIFWFRGPPIAVMAPPKSRAVPRAGRRDRRMVLDCGVPMVLACDMVEFPKATVTQNQVFEGLAWVFAHAPRVETGAAQAEYPVLGIRRVSPGNGPRSEGALRLLRLGIGRKTKPSEMARPSIKGDA